MAERGLPGRTLSSLLLVVLAVASLAGPAAAHRLAPSLLELVEGEAGAVAVVWKTPLQQPRGSDVRPELPEHCRPEALPRAERDGTGVVVRFTVQCGEEGLVGHEVAVRGLDVSGTNALVRVALADGRSVRAVLHGGAPSLMVPERESPWAVARGYARLGIGHIAGGFDHLLFVLGLVLLVGGGRLLLYTITAFTVGHSVTLSLAVLGFVAFPSALVEIVIAATIFAVGLELTREAGEPSLMRRWPWLVAGGFGLLHGLGFAGALTEIGLPAGEIPLALLAFNVGIEVGQLVFVAMTLLAGLALRPVLRAGPALLSRLPAYGIGGLSAYWCIERTLAVVEGR